MIDDERRLEFAQARAHHARARLVGTLGAFQRRLTPAALASDIWEEIRERSSAAAEDGIAFARRRPDVVGAVGALVIGYAFRRQIVRLVRSLFSQAQETEAAADGFKRGESNSPARRRAGQAKETHA